ncbi:MAG: hypothetical protein ACPGPA_00005 [Alphaproteobacteria bacterium]
MTVHVVAEFPFTESGAKDMIEWSVSDVGFAVTRQHKGYQDIKQFLAEDNKTIILTQKWDSKDDHQAYLKARVDGGFLEWLKPRLAGEFKVTYLTEV